MYLNPRKNPGSEAGFTLIEFGLAFGLGLFLMLVLAQVYAIREQSLNSGEAMADWAELKSTVAMALNNSDRCVQLLGEGAQIQDMNVDGGGPFSFITTPVRLYQVPGGTQVLLDPAAGTPINRYRKLRVDSIELEPELLMSETSIPKHLLVKLKISATIPLAAFFSSSRTLVDRIPVMLKLNSLNEIFGCSGVGADFTRPQAIQPIAGCTKPKLLTWDRDGWLCKDPQ